MLAAHPNVQIRVFNPLHRGRSTGPTRALGRLVDLNHQHRRMHNKLWLADDSVAIVGGRNLGDEYFDARPEMNFTDLDLLAAGPVARQLGTSFDQYWNSPLSQPARRLRWFAPSPTALVRLRARLHHYLDSERTRDLALYNRLRRYATAPQLDGWLQELTWAASKPSADERSQDQIKRLDILRTFFCRGTSSPLRSITSSMTIPRIQQFTRKKSALASQRPGTNVDWPRNSS